jgi:hypothetical protein
LAYGPELAGVLLLIGNAMSEAGRRAGFVSTRTLEGSNRWLHDPFAFDQAVQAVKQVLAALRPQGQVKLAITSRKEVGLDFLPSLEPYMDSIGSEVADEFLKKFSREPSRQSKRRKSDRLSGLSCSSG